MQDQLKAIREHVMEELKEVKDTSALEQLRVSVLGKKGELTGILRGMGKLPAEERPKMGQMVNETRAASWRRRWKRTRGRSCAKRKRKSASGARPST